MESGTLTKVLHDFFTTEEGELSLKKGDLFLIHKVIDKHWGFGQSHNQLGNFPLNYLHKVEIPEITDSESLFISIAAFRSDKPGYLSFNEGQIIVGNLDVSSGKINGHIGSIKGVFSSSYVWQVDLKSIENVKKKKKIIRKAKVNINLKAQLDEELDLIIGETITVTEKLDDGWCRGYKENGDEGTFPENFISYLEDISFDKVHERCTDLSLTDDKFSEFFTSTEIYKDFGRNNPSIKDFKYCNSLSNYSNIFPNITLSNVQVSSNYDPIQIKSFLITQFPFTAEYPNELSFKAGQIIEFNKYINSEWAEGMINNVRGIFPISFVKLIYINSQCKIKQSGTSAIKNNLHAHENNDAFQYDELTNSKLPDNYWETIINDHNVVCPSNYLSTDFNPNYKDFSHTLENFIEIRDTKKNFDKKEIELIKRLCKPHRPAPPTPTSEQVVAQYPQIQAISSEENLIISPSIKQKKAEQRQNILRELFLTEKDYLRDLKITYETFNLNDPNFLKLKGIDVTTLFGNISEIINIAEEFLKLIQKVIDCDNECECIGSCFLKMAEKMRVAYGKYCSNHELSLVLLQKYEDKEDIMKIFNKGIETLRIKVVCFDMNSILIKPVQRILKYSLFLNKLLKFSEDNHPCKQKIAEATKVMEDVARYINEYKKKKEVAFKYLHSNNTFIGKIANLNMHSVAKKSSRLSAKLSATFGLTNLPIDPKFDELVKDFVSLEKSTKQLLKDVNQCIYYLDNESQCGEILTEYLYQYFKKVPNDEILNLQKITNTIRTNFIKNFKTSIEFCLISPLNILITLLAGPEVLINKRHDKMLDYDTAIFKNEKSKEKGIIAEDLSNAKNNFETLNQQLLEELPIFIESSTAILYNCIRNFINARKLYNGKIMNEYLNISECVNQVSLKDMLENFLVNHNLLHNQISRFTFDIINMGFNQNYVESWLQSDMHRMNLKIKYPHNKLYMVTQSVFGATSHDLSVIKGTIVGVIKTQNPMGDTSKWFVDNGFLQGFLEKQYLELTTTVKFNEENASVADINNSIDLISLDSSSSEINKYSNNIHTIYTELSKEQENRNKEPKQLCENMCEFVHALCNFNGAKNLETLKIKKGQTLKVLKKHDNKKNPQWWLVEDRSGEKGYVPYNYIQEKEV